MYWSWWNKRLFHEETVKLKASTVYEKLLEYYKQAVSNGSLTENIDKMEITYNRGSVIYSACGIGTELWARHYVKVSVHEDSNEITKIFWDINMKLFGLHVGKNAIIEECKKIAKKLV